METEVDILRRLASDAIRDDSVIGPVKDSEMVFEEIGLVEDAQHRLRNICMRTLHTSDPILRARKEAKGMLLARAEASCTEESLRSGDVILGDFRFYFIANLALGEIVIEDLRGSRAWCRKPDVIGSGFST